MGAENGRKGRRLEAFSGGPRWVVQENCELSNGHFSPYAPDMTAPPAADTHAIIDLLAADGPDVLDERRDLRRAPEEDQGLVDEVRSEIVRQAVRRGGRALPTAPDRGPVTIEPVS